MTYNVRGLNIPSKKHTIMKELKRYGAEVFFLQETHISHESKVKHPGTFRYGFMGTQVLKERGGVAIGFANRICFVLKDRLTDPEGRFLFLKGKLGDEEYTLVNIYAPNKNPMKYLKGILAKLGDFRQGHTIMMGDLNFCLTPGLDSETRARETTCVQLKEVKQKLYASQMVDIWRIQHPKTQDFTFYSPVHGSYSRIDYIFVEHRDIDRVLESKIKISTLSDHAPVSMKMSASGKVGQRAGWHLNKELIRDKEGSTLVARELENNFSYNDTGEVTGSALWEAHKAYIRGILIELGSRKKKGEI